MREFDPIAFDFKYWCTPEGEAIEISDMESSYIESCIKMIKRDLPTNTEELRKRGRRPILVKKIGSPKWYAHYGEIYLEEFKNELKRRGE